MLVVRTSPRVASGARRGRALATAVAVIVMLGLFGGCGSDGGQPDLAAQDKQVELANRLAAVHARVAQARRLVARERQATAQLNRVRSGATTAARSTVQAGISLDRLCAPIPRGLGKASRLAARQRERQRKRTLYFLNLSCPSVRS